MSSKELYIYAWRMDEQYIFIQAIEFFSTLFVYLREREWVSERILERYLFKFSLLREWTLLTFALAIYIEIISLLQEEEEDEEKNKISNKKIVM